MTLTRTNTETSNKKYHSQRKIQRESHCILKDTARSQKPLSLFALGSGPVIFPTFTHVLHNIHTKSVATLRWHRGDTASRSLFIIVKLSFTTTFGHGKKMFSVRLFFLQFSAISGLTQIFVVVGRTHDFR